MINAKLSIASAILFAAAPAFAQGAASPDKRPPANVPVPKYEKPTPLANPSDDPASTGTQGGELGVSSGKDIPAAGTGAEVGPGR